MPTATPLAYVPVEEYLATFYRPDVDYVRRTLVERSLGEFDRGSVVGVLMMLFDRHRYDWKIRVALNTRLQIAFDHYRVPSLCILSAESPKEQILRSPPLLCIEVLSPGDTLRKMRKRVKEYFGIGVTNIWIVDPRTRSVTVCQPGGSDLTQTAGELSLPESPIAIAIDQIFTVLDED